MVITFGRPAGTKTCVCGTLLWAFLCIPTKLLASRESPKTLQVNFTFHLVIFRFSLYYLRNFRQTESMVYESSCFLCMQNRIPRCNEYRNWYSISYPVLLHPTTSLFYNTPPYPLYHTPSFYYICRKNTAVYYQFSNTKSCITLLMFSESVSPSYM